MKNSLVRTSFCITLSLAAFAISAHAQPTLFTYQGKLAEAGSPASGSYQMQIRLFDAVSGGGQIGSTITDVPITATQGIFTVKLDFGANALSGANRWLEIAVRRNSGESYITLSPREQIASSPYSVRTLSAASADALSSACVGCVQDANINSVSGAKVTGSVASATDAANSAQLGGVPAIQFVQTNDSRLTDSRNPLPNSANYIRNNLALQTGGNFNIGGNGFVGGRMGVGTAAPAHQFGVAGGPAWTSDFWTGSVELQNVSALGWRPNTSNQSFGIGQTNWGLSFFRTNSAPGTTSVAADYAMNINNAGNVRIGTFNPNDSNFGKLDVISNNQHGIYSFAAPSGTYGIFGESTSGGGIYGKSVNGPGVVGASTNWVGVYGESTTGNAVWGKSLGTGRAFFAEGNATQSHNRGGWVKALLYVNYDGTILRCYNGTTGDSFAPGNTPNGCGFTVDYRGAGSYVIELGFLTQSRFALVSTTHLGGPNSFALARPVFSGSLIEVKTFITGVSDPDNGSNASFMLAVF